MAKRVKDFYPMINSSQDWSPEKELQINEVKRVNDSKIQITTADSSGNEEL